jgi:hypothetical protein
MINIEEKIPVLNVLTWHLSRDVPAIKEFTKDIASVVRGTTKVTPCII